MSTSDYSIMPARPFAAAKFIYDVKTRAYVVMFPWLFTTCQYLLVFICSSFSTAVFFGNVICVEIRNQWTSQN